MYARYTYSLGILMNKLTRSACPKCGRLMKKDGSHVCPPKGWNRQLLKEIALKTKRCDVCGRIKKKDGSHVCSNTPWNKGKKGVQVAWNKGKQHSEITKSRLSETRRRLYEEGKLPDISGVNNPMYGKKAWNKGIITGKPSWISGRKMPKEIRDKNSGANHYNWKGGYGSINMQIRKSYEYRQWTQTIFKRDNYTCKTCNSRGGRLEAHHIVQFAKLIIINNIKTLKEGIDCKDLWNLDNGQTLCKVCHKQTDSYLRNPKKML